MYKVTKVHTNKLVMEEKIDACISDISYYCDNLPAGSNLSKEVLTMSHGFKAAVRHCWEGGSPCCQGRFDGVHHGRASLIDSVMAVQAQKSSQGQKHGTRALQILSDNEAKCIMQNGFALQSSEI